MKKIAIASDHGGYELKTHLIKFLSEKYQVIDLGCDGNEKVDYPDYAIKAAEMQADNKVDYSIMIDGAGVGSTMTANKISGVRAALCNDLYCAHNSKEHNNANMLVMGSMVVGKGLAEKIVSTFIEVPYAGGRHDNRVNKINKLDMFRGGILDKEALKDIIKNIVIKALGGKEGLNNNDSYTSTDTFEGKILTEQYLKDNKVRKIKISKNTIILPLAKDYISSNKIEVIR